MSFEPVIVGFCCNECAYAAADLAGTSRMSYPPNVRIIRVPCSGHVDLLYLLRAVDLGADGVFVAGCLKGGCHYVDGNLKAERVVNFFKRVLDAVGLGSERAEMFFMAASDAEAFVNAVSSFAERVKSLAPNPRKRALEKLEVAKKRTAVAALVRGIAESLGRLLEELPVVAEVPPAYAEVAVNADKCTGCKACELACEYGAIEFRDKSSRLLLYSPAECTVCEECFDSCPEEALSLGNSLDLAAFASGGFVVKVSLPLAACASCGSPFVTERGKEALAPATPAADLLGLCPDCRKREAASRLARWAAR